MRRPNFVIVFICLSITFKGFYSFGKTEECAAALESIERAEDLFKIDRKDGAHIYRGLSPRGIQVLENVHEDIIKTEQIISARSLENESVTNTVRIVQTGKWNAAILGPPGGGKTAHL